ncbi:hypothetical protein [Arthrobacter sp. NPDC090010]|uniref:hypothetical protein n=1 Tax=Arthrobacter sp. NPDC090010 TaxID=3363942 RepID=UPI0037F8B994
MSAYRHGQSKDAVKQRLDQAASLVQQTRVEASKKVVDARREVRRQRSRANEYRGLYQARLAEDMKTSSGSWSKVTPGRYGGPAGLAAAVRETDAFVRKYGRTWDTGQLRAEPRRKKWVTY